jgi:hypothetical protein
VVRDEV